MSERACGYTMAEGVFCPELEPHYHPGDDAVHSIGCACESCSAAYERERWDPRS